MLCADFRSGRVRPCLLYTSTADGPGNGLHGLILPNHTLVQGFLHVQQLSLIHILLVNAVTGECVYYDVEDIPSWVDHVYSADLILQQYDYYGRYHNGFINSVLGQRDVTVTTQGYNYICLLYTSWAMKRADN